MVSCCCCFVSLLGLIKTVDYYFPLVAYCLRYCQKLPKDSFTVLSPHFVTSKRFIREVMEANPYRIVDQEVEFQTTLSLPMSSMVKEPIKVSTCMERKENSGVVGD